MFLQIVYLIANSTTEEIDGDLWTYQSLKSLRVKYFPWWSLATIDRALDSLAEMQLIKVGEFNKRRADRTRWFALNREGINRLRSVRLDDAAYENEKKARSTSRKRRPQISFLEPEEAPDADTISQNEKSISQIEKPISQNETTISQNETTLPETPTETPTETPGGKREGAPFEPAAPPPDAEPQARPPAGPPNAALESPDGQRPARSGKSSGLKGASSPGGPPAPPRAPAGPAFADGEPITTETPEIRLFREVTGRFPAKDQYELVARTIRAGGFTADALRPFWEQWYVVNRHKPTNLAWLTEWAVSGQVGRPRERAPARGRLPTNPKTGAPEPAGFAALRQFAHNHGITLKDVLNASANTET